MPSLKQITTKIKSVRGTRRIMSAMKLIAAVKLQRSQSILSSYRPYSDAYKDVVFNVASKLEPEDHKLLRRSEEKNKLHMVFLTSDRGLCGSFNTALIRNVENYIKDELSDYSEIKLSFVGKRGKDHFSSSDHESGKYFSGANEKNFPDIAKEIATSLTNEFKEEETDEIILAYNYFHSALNQEMTFEKVLPLEFESNEETEGSSDYIFEPEKKELVDTILPKYIQIRIERAINESMTSEHAARMTAMENATSNADEVIRKLTLLFNKTRQAMITTELMDIVNGTEAQKKGGNE